MLKGFKIKIANIFGIDIELHWSWFLVFGLFTWVVSSRWLPSGAPNQPLLSYWLFGALMVLIVYLSAIVHELSHSRVAQHFNIPINRITLFVLGGVAQLEKRPQSAKVEFLIAVAGPVSSLILAGIFGLLAGFLNLSPLIMTSLTFIAVVNLIFAIFNLVPAYPLDGGRIFKTIWWWILKDEVKATKIAARVGQFFGILMIITGFLKLGLFVAVIGWFIFISAGQDFRHLLFERQKADFEKLLSRIKVESAIDKLEEPVDITAINQKDACCSGDSFSSVIKTMANTKRFWLWVIENNKVIGTINKVDMDKHLREEYAKFKQKK